MGLLDKAKMVVVVISVDVVVNNVDFVVKMLILLLSCLLMFLFATYILHVHTYRVDIAMGLLDKAKMVVFNVSLEPVFFLFCVNLGLVMIPNADLYLSKVGSFPLK